MSASSSTLDYYQHHAKSFVDQTFNVDMSKVYMPFLQALPNDSQKILDIMEKKFTVNLSTLGNIIKKNYLIHFRNYQINLKLYPQL